MDDDELLRQAMSVAAKRRWERSTPEERSEVARKLNQDRWKGKSKKDRSAAAKKAADARWAKKPSKKAK